MSSPADTSFPSVHCPYCHSQWRVSLLWVALKVLLGAAWTGPNCTHQSVKSQLPQLTSMSLPPVPSVVWQCPLPSSAPLSAHCLSVPSPPVQLARVGGLLQSPRGRAAVLSHFLQVLLRGPGVFYRVSWLARYIREISPL